MNAKEQLNKIRTLLGLNVKFEQATLVDGAVVEAEQFAPEFSVGIVTEDGIVPMPVGVYETAEGKLITVEVEGIIATVEDKPMETEEPELEASPAPMQVEEVKAKRIVESVSKETFFEAIEKLTNENEALRLELEALKSPKVIEVELTAQPIVHNPENQKKIELQKIGKPSSIKERIYKDLF
jgi:hypothetical protein